MQNGFVESFNGRLHDKCLNEHLFSNLCHARDLIEEWRLGYNHERPHTSLDRMTPVEYALWSVVTAFDRAASSLAPLWAGSCSCNACTET
jgi:putative transposase